MAVEAGFINGMSLGIEWHNDEDEDFKGALVLDLLIVRVVFAFFK